MHIVAISDSVVIGIGVGVLLAVAVIGLFTHAVISSISDRTPDWTKDRK